VGKIAMEIFFKEYTQIFFYKLINVYGFKLREEYIENSSYFVEFESTDFIISIEKYHKELYVTSYKKKDIKKAINLFYLLEFLNKENGVIQKSNYFSNELNLKKCYKKQLEHISKCIYTNIEKLNKFYNSKDYRNNKKELTKFIKCNYPQLGW